MKALLSPPISMKENKVLEPSVTDTTWLKSDKLYAIGIVERSPEKDKDGNRITLTNKLPKQPDKPKALIPSKGLSTFVKSTKFHPYKSTHPELLTELNELNERRSKRLNAQSVNNDSLETSKIIFQRFIDESTMYQSILSAVKSDYDTTIERLSEQVRLYSVFDDKLIRLQSENTLQVQKLTNDFQLKIKQLEDQVKHLTIKIQVTEKEKAVVESDMRTLREINLNNQKECDDLRATGVTLTNSLARLEEEKRQYQDRDAAAQSEVAVMKGNEAKLSEEIERLQQIIQGMETTQSSMVSHEVVMAQESAMDALHAEMKRVDATHRQLLLRYTALKAMVDGAFKKFETGEGGGVSAFEQNQIQSKVHDVANKRRINKNQGKNKTVITNPADKLMSMIEKGANPRLIIESLLDIIEAHQMEGGNRGNQNNTDNGTALLSTVLPGGTLAFDGNLNTTAEEFRSPWSHFDGLGFEPNVPTYLRFNGKVQNLFLNRKELVLLINEIWAMKLCYETFDTTQQTGGGTHSNVESRAVTAPGSAASSRPGTASTRTAAILKSGITLSNYLVKSLPLNPSLATFLEFYLEDKYNSHMRAVEMAYNMTDALRKYASCSDAMLFSAILEGRLCQEVWHDQHVLTDKLKDELLKENSAHSSSPDLEWKLTPDALMRTIRKSLPTKGEHAFSKLAKALAMDNRGSRFVNVTDLLAEDDSGTRSNFYEQLKLQHITECVTYERHVMDCIDQFNKSSNESEMTIGKLREALIYSDTHKTRTEINQLLSRGCSLSVEETLLMEARRTPQNVDEFKRRLRAGLLKRSAPIGATVGKNK